MALAGRVPVKVSSENGAIKSGDYLIPSSIPGVAMKAQKAGPVIGQAMESWDGEGVGKVVIYIKSSSYLGDAFVSLFEEDQSVQLSSDDILAKILANKDKFKGDSEITTDRLIAGLEIITPKLTADEIHVKRLRADQIEGLDIIAGKLSLLDTNVASISSSLSDKGRRLEKETGFSATPSAFTTGDIVLASLDVEGVATISGDVKARGNVLVEGALSVIDSFRATDVLVTGISNFLGEVIFKDKVRFDQQVKFSKDAAGTVTVKQGQTKVKVTFENAYEDVPVINANLEASGTDAQKQALLGQEYSFAITDRSVNGFTIILNKAALTDIKMSWVSIQTQ